MILSLNQDWNDQMFVKCIVSWWRVPRRYLTKSPRGAQLMLFPSGAGKWAFFQENVCGGKLGCWFVTTDQIDSKIPRETSEKSKRRLRKKFRGKYIITAEAFRSFKKGGKSPPNKARGHFNVYCYWQLMRCRHANISRRLSIFGPHHIFPPFQVYASVWLCRTKPIWRVLATMRRLITPSDLKISVVISTWMKKPVKRLGYRIRE